MHTPSLTLVAGLMVLFAGSPTPVWSQPVPVSTTDASVTQRELSPILARKLARIAIVDLRANASQEPGDYRIAASVLNDAIALDLENLDLLRLAIEAASLAGDTAQRGDLLKRLVLKDPSDTAAQFNLITHRLSSADSAESKLQMIDTLLSPKGESIDPAIRSRLALQAAILHRERANAEAMSKSLSVAVKLDSSNVEAAALAAEYALSRISEPSVRIEFLTNLLIADPFDAESHLALAREFAASGASNASLRFYENARSLAARTKSSLSLTDQADRVVQSWKLSGPAAVVKQLNDALEGPRKEAQVARDLANSRNAGQSPTGILSPDSIRLPIPLERHRIAAAMAIGDSATVKLAMTDFAASVEQLALEGSTVDASIINAARYELAYLRGWTGEQADEFTASLTRLQNDANTPPEVLARLNAWKLARIDKKPADARAMFALMTADPLARMAALQLDIESGDQSPATNAALAALATDLPASPISAWASSVYSNRMKTALQPSPLAERLEAMGTGIPSWVDELARDPWRFVTTTAFVNSASVSALEPSAITFKIRNNSPVPISFGRDGTISSRFLLSSSLDINGVQKPEYSGVEVVDIARRLRLLPKEEIAITIWPEPGVVAWAAESALGSPTRTRWQIMQGFSMQDGQPVPGRLGATLSVGPMARSAVMPATLEQLLTEIGNAQGEAFARTILAARITLLQLRTEALSVGDAHRLIAAITDRYKREERLGRVAILTTLPTASQSPITVGFDRVLATLPETDTLVQKVMLLTRPEATSGLTLNPDATAFQSLLKSRAPGARGYATLTGTTVNALQPKTVNEPVQK